MLEDYAIYSFLLHNSRRNWTQLAEAINMLNLLFILEHSVFEFDQNKLSSSHHKFTQQRKESNCLVYLWWPSQKTFRGSLNKASNEFSKLGCNKFPVYSTFTLDAASSWRWIVAVQLKYNFRDQALWFVAFNFYNILATFNAFIHVLAVFWLQLYILF